MPCGVNIREITGTVSSLLDLKAGCHGGICPLIALILFCPYYHQVNSLARHLTG